MWCKIGPKLDSSSVHFYICLLKSTTNYRLKAIKQYPQLRTLKSHLTNNNSILGKVWTKFLLRWDKQEKITKIKKEIVQMLHIYIL